VEADRVLFLDIPDGALTHSLVEAVRPVSEILIQTAPEEIYIPYRGETPPDHTAARRIVLSALQAVRRPAEVYEYPIWYWNQWPWTWLSGYQPNRWAVIKNSLNSGLGVRFLRDFRVRVDIRSVLEVKRAALNQHKTQMERVNGDPGWLTLGDLTNGQFLACFCQAYELFLNYRL
jgi:LmbE family N-acetylglucosaminyl deacetylase